MPLVKAFRALLLLVALLAIVPVQAGGALAADQQGLTMSSSPISVSKAGREGGPLTASTRSQFVAPDDGTATCRILHVLPRATSCARAPLVNTRLAEPASGFRLERPPKSA